MQPLDPVQPSGDNTPVQPVVPVPAVPTPPSPATAAIYPAPGAVQAQAPVVQPVEEQKDFVLAFLLSWLLGGLGADRFYLGYVKTGVLKLITFGGIGIWAAIDVARLAFGSLHDKDGTPLKGYEKNKTWTRVLAILHILLIVGIILMFAVTLFLSANMGVKRQARDTQRKTAINALQARLEQYKAMHGEYPTLAQLNSSSFRQQNFADLGSSNYEDPQGSTDQLTSSFSFTQYEYSPAPDGCTDQGNDKCTSYTLTAALESGGDYTKTSLN